MYISSVVGILIEDDNAFKGLTVAGLGLQEREYFVFIGVSGEVVPLPAVDVEIVSGECCKVADNQIHPIACHME